MKFRVLLGLAALLEPGCSTTSADPAPSTAPQTAAADTPEALSPRTAPMYAPSGRSPEKLAIDDPEYGAFDGAPDALELGDAFPDFDLAATTESGRLRRGEVGGPLVVVFYRGHW